MVPKPMASAVVRPIDKKQTKSPRTFAFLECPRDEARLGTKFWVRTQLGTIELLDPGPGLKMPRGWSYVKPCEEVARG